MIPPTINRLSAMACLSALQKYIRRAMELEAMQVAVELHRTSKAFCSMVAKRLEVISHEDIDSLQCPWIVPYVATAAEQARTWYDPHKLGKSRMALGNAIRLMCRAPKSREGDHFHASIGGASELENFVPVIPDWVNDQHTQAGKRAGRGVQYFREVSTLLVPPQASKDAYEDEAYRMWEIRAKLKAGLFPENEPEPDEN